MVRVLCQKLQRRAFRSPCQSQYTAHEERSARQDEQSVVVFLDEVIVVHVRHFQLHA
jgi:hypothetical protein